MTDIPGIATDYEHPQGTQILVVGIVGLALCQLVAPVAWIKGSRALAEIDDAPGTAMNRGMIQAGRVCGIIGTILLAMPLLSIPFIILLRSAS